MEDDYWCHMCQSTVKCDAEELCLTCGFGDVEKIRRPLQYALRAEELGGLQERMRMLFDMLNDAYEAHEEGMGDEEVDALPEREQLEDFCAVCLHDREDRVVSLPCGHSYHDLCLRNWLKVKATCPVCKRSAREAEAEF